MEDLIINQISEIKAEEDNKIDEISYLNSANSVNKVNSINEITIEINEEKESKISDNNFEDINKYNVSRGGKLIKLILFWLKILLTNI